MRVRRCTPMEKCSSASGQSTIHQPSPVAFREANPKRRWYCGRSVYSVRMKWNSAPVGNSGRGPAAPWRMPPPNRWASAARAASRTAAEITPRRALIRLDKTAPVNNRRADCQSAPHADCQSAPQRDSSGQVEAVDFAGGIAEVIGVHAHAIHHTEEEIAHGSFLAIDHAAAGLDGLAGAPGDQRGKVVVGVPVAVGEAGAVDDHAVIEQRAVTFLDRLQLLHPGGELEHVIAVDLRHLFHQIGLIAVVGERMEAVGYADLAVGARGA